MMEKVAKGIIIDVPLTSGAIFANGILLDRYKSDLQNASI